MDEITKKVAKIVFIGCLLLGYFCIWVASYGIILKNLGWVLLGVIGWTLICYGIKEILYRLYLWIEKEE